jgi:hypothetical protein
MEGFECDVTVMWGRLVKCNGPLLRSSAYHCQLESFKSHL